jgi:hypothetical protein
MTGLSDTSPEIEAMLVSGYRSMTPAQKVARVVALNRALDALATARLRAQYGPDIEEREMRLRLAALRLDARLMRDAFGWDPTERGL